MPLAKGSSNATRERNRKERSKAGHTPKEAVAAAEDQQRRSASKKGKQSMTAGKRRTREGEPSTVTVSGEQLGGTVILENGAVAYTREGAVSAVPGGPVDPSIIPGQFDPPPPPEPLPDPPATRASGA